MKKVLIILGMAALAVAGCATTQVSSVAPVGPGPGSVAPATGNGQLEVYSALSARLEGTNPTWRQHSDYFVFSMDGGG
ncbi:MAG TPA: hypothetical protein VME24_09245 [Alphaproteobacteria bacterium]|nr:hypothetical protein [Verrucomicrobiae bacterium]HUA66021.1 hypothetical protein [Alphaproteobacteria bacterium]